jgi:ABC-2 type transport system permease protein
VSAAVGTVRDSGLVAWRNLINIRRMPDLLLGATLQPVMFVLLFAYVFAGSLGGAAYREYLIPGIFAQTVAFNSAYTTMGLASDLQKGIIDRFRSLPMSRLAVILGRTTSDLIVTVVTVAVMAVCGLIVGWRIRGSWSDAVAGFALILLFSFAMSWIGALIGLSVRSIEVAQSAGLIWLFPVAFVSSVFVKADTLPGPLQVFAEWNPISTLADAMRQLFGNTIPGTPVSDVWPAQHPALYTIIASLVIVALFAPLAVAKYRRVASR